MSWKMRGILGVLGLAAAFLSWQFLSSFKVTQPNTKTSAADNGQLSALLSSNDADRDGLSDSEESVWNADFQNPDTDGDGYLDGEEVASGHNPTVPGPDDYIDGFNGENLSKRLQEMLVAGLAEGSLKPSADTFSSSTAAIADNLAEKLKEQTEVPEPQIIVANDSLAAKQNYVTAVFPIMQALPEDITPQSEDPFVYTPAQQQKLTAVLAKLKETPTPRSWAQFHARLIVSVASIERSYALLAQAEEAKDLVTKLGINNQLVELMYTTLPQIYEDFFSMIENP